MFKGLIECRELNLCWHCQVSLATGDLEDYPICDKCRVKYTVKMVVKKVVKKEAE